MAGRKESEAGGVYFKWTRRVYQLESKALKEVCENLKRIFNIPINPELTQDIYSCPQALPPPPEHLHQPWPSHGSLELWKQEGNVTAESRRKGSSTASQPGECSQLCPTLCNPIDCSPSGSSVHGITQARILERVAISFSRGSS